MSFSSNGVDLVRSLRQIPTRLRGMNFCINCTSSAHFASSLKEQRNGYKCTQTLRYATKHEFRVQWSGLGAFFSKTSDATLWHELLHYLHQFSPFCTEFTVVTKHSQMHQNTMKRTKTWGYGPMGWIGCARCEKLWRDFVAWTFCINC
jgi:hypothetical protein